jgi:hypothetical protein
MSPLVFITSEAEDYYAAMAQVEQRIELAAKEGTNGQAPSAEELVAMLDSLRESRLDTTQEAAVIAVQEGILELANGN